MKPSDFTVGQQIVVAYTANRKEPDARGATVTAVGRKWVSFADRQMKDRFDPEDMTIDDRGFMSPGRVYLTVDHFEREQQKRALWSEMRQLIQHGGPPEALTLGALRQFVHCLRKAAK